MMKKVILHISCSVQRAGYRSEVVTMAGVLGIKGHVANLQDGRVKIIAEGNEIDLERFIQAVSIKNDLINITYIKKEYFSLIGGYEGFCKLIRDEEIDEELNSVEVIDLLKELISVWEEVGRDKNSDSSHLTYSGVQNKNRING